MRVFRLAKLTSVVFRSLPSTNERRLPTGISSRLRLVKRLEGKNEEMNFVCLTDRFDLGSNMLKRWQELAEPSLSSCLQSIPGVYTRAEILHEVNEEDEEDSITPQNELEGKRNKHST